MIWRGRERRETIRLHVRMTVHVELSGQPRFYEAVSRDLSTSGACLALRQLLGHCTPIYLEFRLPGVLNTLYCPAHVVWSKRVIASMLPDKEPSFLMGIEFVRPPRAVRREVKGFIAERLKAERQKTSS